MVSELSLMGGTPREATFPLIRPIPEPQENNNPPLLHCSGRPLFSCFQAIGGGGLLISSSWGGAGGEKGTAYTSGIYLSSTVHLVLQYRGRGTPSQKMHDKTRFRERLPCPIRIWKRHTDTHKTCMPNSLFVCVPLVPCSALRRAEIPPISIFTR